MGDAWFGAEKRCSDWGLLGVRDDAGQQVSLSECQTAAPELPGDLQKLSHHHDLAGSCPDPSPGQLTRTPACGGDVVLEWHAVETAC